MQYVPVVDISRVGLLEDSCNVTKEDHRTVGADLYKALSEVGFAYLKNSGFTDEYINGVQRKYDEFFALDNDVKHKYKFAETGFGRGYGGVGEESVSAYGHEKDFKETFDIDGEVMAGIKKYELPDDKVEGFSKSCFGFGAKCKELADRLFVTLGYGMKLKDPKYLLQHHRNLSNTGNSSQFRSNFYPPVSGDQRKSLNVRLGEHSDYGSYTFLFIDKVGGLQIQKSDGKFIDVPQIPDTIIMNIGNILNIWSDGRLLATVHRVRLPTDDAPAITRRSLAYFFHPDDDAPITQLEYEDGADPPRPEKKILNPAANDAPKTAIEWIGALLNRIQTVDQYNI